MAEFLVKAIDRTHADPTTDRGSYKRGDIVTAQPDGWPWGAEEHPATADPRVFWLVKVPGLNPENARVQELMMVDEDAEGVLWRRRLWRVVVDEIPATIKQQILTTGVVTVTLAQIRNYIRNHRTGESF